MRAGGKSLVLAGAVALSTLATGPAGIARAHCYAPGVQRTIEVKIKVLDKVVARGEIVRIEVRTYRPAQKDFLELGVDMPPGTPMEPVGNVRITLAVMTANQYRSQAIATQTDDNGRRLVKMRLESYQRKGPGDVSARAFLDHFSERPANVCVEAQEGGYTVVENVLTVR